MTRRRGPSSPSPGPAHPLEDDDLLHEILLRLPPQPPYLLRASLVSKRWRGLATEPKFLRRFRLHHRKPPLLGVFSCSGGSISFRSTLDRPYRIPPERFSPRRHRDWSCLDCRHGRVLFDDWSQHKVIVWDPITDDYRFVAYPPQLFDSGLVQTHRGAVLCAAGDQGHVHGACHTSPFKVVWLSSYGHDDEAVAFASVYSSETDIWGDRISAPLPHRATYFSCPSTLVGNTLNWLLNICGIPEVDSDMLEFDLDTQRLVVTKSPPGGPHVDDALIIQAEDGGVGFAALSGPRLQMWDKKVNSHGVTTWVLRKTVEMRKILGFGFKTDEAILIDYAEDINAIFLGVHSTVYMVQLGSMQSQQLFTDYLCSGVHPFTSYY